MAFRKEVFSSKWLKDRNAVLKPKSGERRSVQSKPFGSNYVFWEESPVLQQIVFLSRKKPISGI